MQASKSEALLAIDLYNRSGNERQLEAFIVHMSMAWLKLMQAHVERTGGDLYVRDKRGRRVRHKDGGWTMRPLHDLTATLLGQNSATRANLDFFTGLRNIVEHRYERDIASLVADRTQAHVLNYEHTLSTWFGASEGLGEQLRFPIFLSTISGDAVQAVKELRKRVPKGVLEWVQDFDASLDPMTTQDPAFDFRLFLIPHTGPKTTADAAMTFVKVEDLDPKQRATIDQVQTIIRDKQVPVSNLDLHRPSEVVDLVSKRIGTKISLHDHTCAWRHHKVRPERTRRSQRPPSSSTASGTGPSSSTCTRMLG